MTWNELKPLIEDDFLSRQLKDPSIRLRALDNIEALLKVHMPELLNDILAICNIEKKEFKKQIAHYKGKELNGAEKSVINDIYRHCQGIEYDIQVALQSQNIQNNRYGNGSNNIENNKDIFFPVTTDSFILLMTKDSLSPLQAEPSFFSITFLTK